MVLSSRSRNARKNISSVSIVHGRCGEDGLNHFQTSLRSNVVTGG